MADITKCIDKECPYKENCYRWTAPNGFLQSYFMESPRKGDKCNHYWGENWKDIWDETEIEPND